MKNKRGDKTCLRILNNLKYIWCHTDYQNANRTLEKKILKHI